jgi:choice-of-anchor B domain-containing protein
MASIRNASRTGVLSVTLAGLSLVAGLAIAHDPDLRKLEDKQPPVFGDIYRLGDPVPRSGGFDASGMTLLSQIPLNNFPGVARASGNDCWGYVSPSGREYAIMGLQGGFGFVEITNPTNPVIVATIPGPSSDWHDVKVVGSVAYGVSEGGAGIQVMNMANIDNGQVTLVRNWTSGGYSTTHNIVTNEDNGSLWICGANIGNGGLIKIDLTNPTLPSFDGGWTQMYVHDAQVVTWDNGPLSGRELAFCLAGFNTGITDTGLRIVDVTNPNSPQVLSTLFYPGAQYAHQGWLSEDRRFLYLNDELDEGATVSVTTTRVINVEDPTNPYLVKTFTTGLASIDHNLYTHNGLIFQSNYRSGLRVFDALDPANPSELAYFDTYPGSNSADYNGAWSNYPYFPSGTIIVSDIERGLFVLRLDAEPAAVAVSVPQNSAPEVIDPAGGDPITAHAVARSSSNPLASVELMVDSGSGFQPVPATDNGDGTFTAVFPPVACDSTVRAYFRATAAGGQEAFFPGDAPGETFSFTVASDVVELFADDFSTNQGWTPGVAGDTATTGIWTRVNPVGTAAQPGDALFGNFCYVTGQGANGGGLGDNDVDSGRTTLLSPAFSLAGESADTTISYWRWYSNSAGASPFADVFTVDISSNNGQTWTNVETVGPDGPEVSGGWFKHSFRPADFVNLTNQTRLRFIASDLGSGSIVEAAVDGVRIERFDCVDPNPGCSPADLAEPFGTLNFFDLAAYLALFNANDPGADLASPFGTLNFFDISAYLSGYNAGCP